MSNKAKLQHRSAGMSKEAIQASLADHLVYSNSKYHSNATTRDWFQTTAHTVRNRLVERWMETMLLRARCQTYLLSVAGIPRGAHFEQRHAQSGDGRAVQNCTL